jgi:hypothetical protein
MVMAPTNNAARKVGGVTVHNFVHRNVFLRQYRGWIVIDEFSMLSPDLCAALEHLRDCKFVLFGDREQLPPVVNAWRGQPSKYLWESQLLGMWADWARVELPTYYRSADRSFADWFISARHRPLAETVAEALARWPVTEEPADWSFCVSNARRRRINSARQRQLAAGRADCVTMTLEGEQVSLFPGTRLISCLTKKHFVNGAVLEFRGAAGEGLFRLYDYDTKAEFVAEERRIEKACRLAWCITIYASQSATVDGRVRIHDLRSPRFSQALLYVAVSRVSDPSKLECVA